MKAGKLLSIWRQEVEDTEKPYLWGDDEFLDYLNDAEVEAARRARLLVDSSTASICTITIDAADVAAGTAEYDLSPKVIAVRRAKSSERGTPLARATRKDLDDSYPGWEDHTGAIEAFITEDTGKILFWRIPDTTQTISLTVVRDPVNEMNDLEDSPEIQERYHRSLLYWVKYRAYMKPDSEAFNSELAQLNEQMFEREFGPKRRAIDEAYELQHQYDPDDGAF